MNLLIIMIIFNHVQSLYIAKPIYSRRVIGYGRNLVKICSISSEMSENVKSIAAWVEPGRVYFVATPIGNKHDITNRAYGVLSEADVICAEDTRQTIELLRRLQIPHKKLISHHEHNQAQSIPQIIELARSGNSIAVVSDAGTPGISDPGSPLAAALASASIPLHPIPGPSSVITALSICGFYASEFTFLGFLPVKGKEKKEKMEKINTYTHTLVFFEAPHRILKTFQELISVYSGLLDRDCVCCRELTKKHEEIKRGKVRDIVHWLEASESQKEVDGIGIRGEFTIVLGPVHTNKKEMWQTLIGDLEQEENSPEIDPKGLLQIQTEELDAKSRVRLELQKCRDQGLKRSEAVKEVASKLKAPRSTIYSIALKESWS